MSMADHTDPLQITPDPQTLHTYHRQQLSAMLDGELSPDEAKFMLRRLEHDVALAQCWERWQVCGEILRGRTDDILPADFAARVAVAVQGPLPRSGNRAKARHRSRVLRWGGVGMAASLALVAIGMAVRSPTPEAAPDSLAVEADSGVPSPMPAPGPHMAALQSAPAKMLPAPPPVTTPAQTPDVTGMGTAVATRHDRSERAARELLAPTTVPPVVPRPWPRAGVGSGQLTVGYQAAPMMTVAPFSPRWLPPVPTTQPASRAASGLSADQAERGVAQQH